MQTIKATVSDGTKKYTQDFSYLQFSHLEGEGDEEKSVVGTEDVLELIAELNKGGDEALDLCKSFNYGSNLRARATARAQANAKAEGPDKAIAKAVAGLMALGWSEDEAIAAAKAKLAA